MPKQQVNRLNYELHSSLPLSFFPHMGLGLYIRGKDCSYCLFMLFSSSVNPFASMTGSPHANPFGYSLLERFLKYLD